MYADKYCRINTYGNSFTQCHQVSDGETWQEILAAHFCEPIRNFGVGGYSVYQAYLRMRREERRTPSEYIVFNIYDDDHYRNLDAWPRIRIGAPNGTPTRPYVKANPTTGEFLECKNPCPTMGSFYKLCNLDWVYETFKNDFELKIKMAYENVKKSHPEKSYAEITDIASKHGVETQIDSGEKLIKTVDNLYLRSAIFASMKIVEKVEEFAAANKKKVLYVLSYSDANIVNKIREGYRVDQEFVNFLKRKELPYVDLMDVHVREFNQFKISIEDYLKRYYIGHYNPLGNFLQAFTIKDKLVEMLQPKPISYLGHT
jgi:hypothetical protein